MPVFCKVTEVTFVSLFVLMPESVVMADTGGRADLRQLASWDCRFQSHRGMDVCVCGAGKGICDGPILRHEEAYRVCTYH